MPDWPELRRGMTGDLIWSNPDVHVLVERTDILRREVRQLRELVFELVKSVKGLSDVQARAYIERIHELYESEET